MLNHDEFNQKFERAKKTAMVGGIVSVLCGASVLVFVGWVIIKTMQHFGIV